MNWISIKDSLPENGLMVLCYCDNCDTHCLGFYDESFGGWSYPVFTANRMPIISHWKKLDKPVLDVIYPK